jgi:phenylalanyl-tRNA synthetase alpha chain
VHPRHESIIQRRALESRSHQASIVCASLTQEVLDLLNTKDSVSTESDLADVGQAEIKAALDRLASRNMVVYETNDQEQVILTKEGEQIANEGSHEFKVWDAVKRRGQMPLKELQV